MMAASLCKSHNILYTKKLKLIILPTRELTLNSADLHQTITLINFKLTLKWTTETFMFPRYTQLLIKHMWIMGKNFNKIHQQVFELAAHLQTNKAKDSRLHE